MYRISFVILHYMSLSYTQTCVDSILEKDAYGKVDIIIVDNGSSNSSGEELEKIYDRNPNVYIIKIKENLGFAKGNNIGYLYAKKERKSDFIIVTNNDTIFQQELFVAKCIELYKSEKYAVLGPDILTLEGGHQNPLRTELFTLKEIRKTIFKWKILYCYYVLISKYKLFKKITFLNNLYELRKKKSINERNFKVQQEGIVPHGACIVYSPDYIERFNEAFDSNTFMYMEESILACKCKRLHLKILYSPGVQVVHAEKGSTGESFVTDYSRKMFYLKESIRSSGILVSELKRGEK